MYMMYDFPIMLIPFLAVFCYYFSSYHKYTMFSIITNFAFSMGTLTFLRKLLISHFFWNFLCYMWLKFEPILSGSLKFKIA